MTHASKKQRYLMRAGASASVVVALVLIAAKSLAWWKTGSVALLGSLTDSVLDFLASLINFVAVRASLTPPDEDHRFGHGKAEAIAGLFQSSLILGSAVFIGWHAWERILDPVVVDHSVLGIGVSFFAIALTLGLVIFQKHVIKHTGSVAISADRLHYVGDLLLNSAVIVALVLSTFANIPGADGWFGLGIAVYIAWNAYLIARSSIDMLMDKEFSNQEREQIFNLVMGNKDVKGMHDLKTRKSGLMSFIQMHIELDPEMPLYEAHTVADEVEATIGEAFAGAEIIIHTDPLGLEEAETVLELERDE